jgi:phosphoglycolate phosphatase
MTGRPPRPAALIFDLDGTLVDSFADITTALNLTRARYGLPPLPRPEVTRHVGSGSPQLVRELVPVPPEAREDALAYYLAAYREHALEQTRLYPGVPEVLEHFRGCRLAVVTNKSFRLTRRILEGLGVWERFQLVLGGDSLERSKPDPLPLLHVMATFALPPEAVVMVGDGLHDIEAGRAAGIRTVAVTTGVEARAALAAAGADHVIDRLDALRDLFR